MVSKIGYIGSLTNIECLLVKNISLNDQVLDTVNDTQELLMLNTLSYESNENTLIKCMRARVSDIASWRWVLNDLAKRLEEALSGLRYEHKALHVVVKRVETEITEFSGASTRPGVLTPMTDFVEEAIFQENKFLVCQRKRFKSMIAELDNETSNLLSTKRRLENDVTAKDKALAIEKKCINFEPEHLQNCLLRKKNKNRGTPIERWKERCENLKKAGLMALTNAIFVRQKVRGARNQLSIVAQSHASRVDTVLRRRTHINRTRLDELKWQKQEIERDLASLDEELMATEKTILSNMDHIKLLQARRIARRLKPRRELTRDLIDDNLKTELCRLQKFNQHLRNNITSIHSLKNQLQIASTNTDFAMTDLNQVLDLDISRIQARSGVVSSQAGVSLTSQPTQTPAAPSDSLRTATKENIGIHEKQPSLYTIIEEGDGEDECDGNCDDYPFNF